MAWFWWLLWIAIVVLWVLVNGAQGPSAPRQTDVGRGYGDKV